MKNITNSCPECGDKNTLHNDLLEEGYRVCKNCHQEYYINIDYSKRGDNNGKRC